MSTASIRSMITGLPDTHASTDIDNATPWVPSPESVRHYQALRTEAERLEGLRREEADKADGLAEQIADLEAERIAALTEHRVEGNEEALGLADKLLDQLTRLQQWQADARGIAANIEVRLVNLRGDIDDAREAARLALGEQFDAWASALSVRYRDLITRELIDTVTAMAVVNSLMVKLGVGNSNGFDHDFRLPAMVHREWRPCEPLLDGHSGSFAATVTDLREALRTELAAAGYDIR